ncbi:MAG TPA: DUF3747 domain-containing protein [Cyanobium sp.]|nr:DUF3747 domain-containing protein [Cyanobium sp.]
MQRTYLALVGLALASAALPATLPALAAGVFQSQPVDSTRFAVLARPLASGDWSLLILEQIQPSPLCWQQRSDGLIDPVLNRFNYTGICGRYLDSNGYSLRVGEEDLGSTYRLNLEQRGAELLLQATSPGEPNGLVVGRARVSQRDRDAFVALELEPGWQLQRRTYGERSLNHVYLANAGALGDLLVRAGGNRTTAPLMGPALAAPVPPLQPLPPIAAPVAPQARSMGSLVAMGRSTNLPRQRRSAAATGLEAALQGIGAGSERSERTGSNGRTRRERIAEPLPATAMVEEPLRAEEPMLASGQAIPLQVIPFRE